MSKLGKISLIFAIMSILAFTLARFLLGGWMPFYTILLGFFAAFLIAALFLDRKFFGEFFTMKTTKHGMNMGAMILLVVALLVVVNYIAIKRNKTWDFSQAQTNTLSDQSVKVVKALKNELKVVFFYKQGTQGADENRKAFREILKKYQDLSNQIRLEFYEVNENPQLAEEYGVNKGGGIAFVEYEGKKNRLERIDEQEITQAIIKVTQKSSKTAYFVVGQGELNIEDSQEATGLNSFKMLVSNNSFNVKTWDLSASPQVPNDADAVFVVGPQKKFADYELKALEDYLKAGGNLMLALEPQKTFGLETLLAKVAITPGNNFVRSSYMGMGFIDGPTLGNVFSENSKISRVLNGPGASVRMNWPMDIKTGTAPEGVKLEAIVKSDKNSTAFKSQKLEPGDFPTGPFQFGVEATGRWPGGAKDFQLVVYGDADFLTNKFLFESLNRDLALNTVSQLTKEENLISISPRSVQKTELALTTARMGGFYISMILIPVCLFVTAGAFFLRRRRV